MTDVDAVQGVVEERRDELIALVRELVSHPSEYPKLLAEPAAQVRAGAAESACHDPLCGVA